MIDLKKIKEIYTNGGNIIEYLKSLKNTRQNDISDILISYDFQAGSYTKFAKKNPEYIEKYTTSISKIINNLGDFKSIIEVGVGEATVLLPFVKKLNLLPQKVLGFDISLSRILYARKNVQKEKINNIELFVADLFSIPLKDNSVDIVFTSHALEPNGGKEKAALQELYRIAGKYIVLLEPVFEFASTEGQKRMEKMGYIRDLYNVAISLGYNVVEYKKFDQILNPLNPTGVLIIEKDKTHQTKAPELVCPLFHTKLSKTKKCYLYSKNSLLAYPVIDNIPILLKDKAIVATHLNEFE